MDENHLSLPIDDGSVEIGISSYGLHVTGYPDRDMQDSKERLNLSSQVVILTVTSQRMEELNLPLLAEFSLLKKLVYAVGIEPTMFLMSRVTVCRHTTNSSLTYIEIGVLGESRTHNITVFWRQSLYQFAYTDNKNKQKVKLIYIDQFFIYFLHLVTALLFQVQAVLPRSLWVYQALTKHQGVLKLL